MQNLNELEIESVNGAGEKGAAIGAAVGKKIAGDTGAKVGAFVGDKLEDFVKSFLK